LEKNINIKCSIYISERFRAAAKQSLANYSKPRQIGSAGGQPSMVFFIILNHLLFKKGSLISKSQKNYGKLPHAVLFQYSDTFEQGQFQKHQEPFFNIFNVSTQNVITFFRSLNIVEYLMPIAVGCNLKNKTNIINFSVSPMQ